MQTKHYLLLLFFLAYHCTIIAQNSLYVLDPRRGNWTQQPGTIDEATLVTRPEGIYTAVDMYLTVSAKGTTFTNPFDTLEVVLNFSLPSEAIVFDSWLWIDTVIIKADILDRWTASTIYENVVQRRQDPSILFKEGNGRYQLRIFPMAANKSRRVKISYLVPAQWSASRVTTALPFELFKTSRNPLPTVTLRAVFNPKWQQPFFVNATDLSFSPKVDGGVTYWQTTLQNQDFSRSPLLTYTSPLQDGVYVSQWSKGNSGIYQLIFSPKEAFDLTTVAPKKVMVLIDYVAGNTPNLTTAEMLIQIKQQLLATLTPRDSFNLAISKLTIKPISEKWIAATPQAIDAAFTSLNSQPFSGFSTLAPLLGQGVDFIQRNGNDGNIWLLANSSSFSDVSSSNALIANLRTAMNNQPIGMYISDFQQQNYLYTWVGNRYFRGNEYLYTNLARVTSGHYIHLFDCCKTFAQAVRETLGAVTALSGSLDLYTRLQNGLCHNRINLTTNLDAVNFNEPIYQVGKFEGELPFIIEAVGSLNGNLVSTQLTLDENDLATADSLSQEIWSGNHIASLERLEQTNATVNKIISESLNERVLSLYTAFIALEPAQGGKPCLNCVDESGGPTVGVEEVLLDSLVSITAAPNPFRHEVKLSLQFIENQDLTDYQFAIYNLVGQQVKVFNDLPRTTTNRLELSWETGDDVPPGVYFFIMQSTRGRQTLKLVKL